MKKISLVSLVDKELVKKEINLLYRFMKETNKSFDIEKSVLKSMVISQLKDYFHYSSKRMDWSIFSEDQIEELVYDLLEDFFGRAYDSISSMYYYKQLLDYTLLDVSRFKN